MKIRKWAIILFLILFKCSASLAQQHQIFKDNIRSLQVVANKDWLSLPVMELGNGSLSVDFDDMGHEYHRYTYFVEHCEANWQMSSSLFESDFIEGFATDNTIDDIQESTLTNTLYTHYHINIPNEKCRPKISGNYILTVFDSSHQKVFRACFMITEPKEKGMGIALKVITNTDATINNSHQQVEMELNYGKYSITNPNEQIKTVLLQNKRWDIARWNAKPQYVMSDGLKWIHNQDYIFLAGNEYRKFEILSTDVATMGIEHIYWDGQEFHAYPFISIPRPNYLFDEDANGSFLIRNSDNINNETESDYMTVHFQLKSPYIPDGEIFVNGDWTNGDFSDKYKLTFNESEMLYHLEIPLKLGYYSYQFLIKDKFGKSHFPPSEGSYYQTENSYQALIYYREQGARTDRLVGYKSVNFIAR